MEKLKNTKDQVYKLEEQVNELGHINTRLSIRAAVGFSNLTPRPNLDMVYK